MSIFFDVILGSSRMSVQLREFVTCTINSGTGFPMLPRVYTSTEYPPALTPPANLIREIPAQSIRVSARIFVNQGPNMIPTCEISAQVAPRTHVRPEWFSEEFKGGENEGS